MILENFLKRVADTDAVVGIVGLGYVGLPLILRFSEVGFPTIGFDIDESKVVALETGRSYIDHIPSSQIEAARAAGLQATTDFSRASECDALLICVPTPLGRHREPDLSYVLDTVEALLPHIREGQLMALESTTYPGTTDEELLPRIAARGFAVGEDYFLVFSPEREDPGNPNFTTRTIPKVVGGDTEASQQAGLALYGRIIDTVVPVSSTRAAEMTKLLENIHRAVNIGLVNEMKVVADKMGIDIHEVIGAAATKPFGFVPYQPGPGLGGHCIPIDPFYLSWKAREFGVNARFIELAGEINSSMPDYVIGKLATALNDAGKTIRGSRVLVLGIAYKKNVGDMRESPSVVLMERLEDMGAVVTYHDPHVPVFPKMRDHRHFDLASVTLDAATLAAADVVLLATDHDGFDYDLIANNSPLIVDTRGRYRTPRPNIIKA
ncbi:UDP-N-acetyl-D-glucosamine dehydrogenase [Sphingopyxis sp. YR583]|uniref:nucleotide sugar dehydrogenase n=1 Tax=Sphingopyxis sp. YR583 TaxID=1881047 RepID=UPI0008A7FED7|nr:nucleotide sugar dehydrogenase [Sphingopyxis sp. YR583]SEH18294.1 UDP-N-acetyl-D-glucosamine dehydrogenase [Sphingopyxis sp. YR583]